MIFGTLFRHVVAQRGLAADGRGTALTLVSRALTNRRPRSSSQIMSSCPITTNFVAFDEQQDGRRAIFPHRLRECLRAKLSPAEFRTRRPSHINEMPRYLAVFERPLYVTRWRRTGWRGMWDSNRRIRPRGI
jgi:hypothetical protein